MDVLDLLSTDNYIPLNRSLAKEIGVENAIVFGALCGYQRKFKGQEFYREQDKIMEDTCLSEYIIRKSIKELQLLDLIYVVKKGLPAKYYFRVNTQKIINILSTSGIKSDTTGDIKNDTNGNIKNANTNNKKDNNKTINNNINIIVAVIDYLNEKANKRYSSKRKTTQEHINARINDGYTLDDFKRVIDIKCSKWLGNPKMEDYLRPDTLFGNKFESYLNESPKINDGKQANTRQYSKEEYSEMFDNINEIDI